MPCTGLYSKVSIETINVKWTFRDWLKRMQNFSNSNANSNFCFVQIFFNLIKVFFIVIIMFLKCKLPSSSFHCKSYNVQFKTSDVSTQRFLNRNMQDFQEFITILKRVKLFQKQ